MTETAQDNVRRIAELMVKRRGLHDEIAEVDKEIEAIVLEMKSTQKIAGVTARYNSGRGSWDYEGAARAHPDFQRAFDETCYPVYDKEGFFEDAKYYVPEEILKDNTTYDVNWSDLCTALGISKDDIPYTKTKEPWVTIKVEG